MIIADGMIGVRTGAWSQPGFSGKTEQLGKPHEHSVIPEANGEENEDHEEIVT